MPLRIMSHCWPSPMKEVHPNFSYNACEAAMSLTARLTENAPTCKRAPYRLGVRDAIVVSYVHSGNLLRHHRWRSRRDEVLRPLQQMTSSAFAASCCAVTCVGFISMRGSFRTVTGFV